MDTSINQSTSASLVVEHTVPKGKGFAFRRWHGSLTRSAKRSKGYIRTDLYPPVKGSQLTWYSIIHFDSPENLNQWLKSSDREELIEAGQKVFESYQFKSFATGLEGWFSRKTGSEQLGSGPPAWKQNLAVVLGLYPVVMIQSMLFTTFGIMKHWSPASSMLVNNLITSSILTWLVMPFVTRLIQFWLQPAHQAALPKTDLLGIGVITVSLAVMVLLFNQIG
jgi:uncharacterized protein